ncbi:hypothetical protein DCC85_05295 [Paenibacillus sp. CAA11]|uniref:hypothetical protein n=1 Tax=Paenibacillus sp. CAA11 TaxID=1532905 RepID=UPI000D399988|nr:hypothetical protein [Paenibacillus sp. CAA11]AWB43691.1 hypothetical protein DCC85_05295 [Paenibacillus sp. CAA11]
MRVNRFGQNNSFSDYYLLDDELKVKAVVEDDGEYVAKLRYASLTKPAEEAEKKRERAEYDQYYAKYCNNRKI